MYVQHLNAAGSPLAPSSGGWCEQQQSHGYFSVVAAEEEEEEEEEEDHILQLCPPASHRRLTRSEPAAQSTQSGHEQRVAAKTSIHPESR